MNDARRPAAESHSSTLQRVALAAMAVIGAFLVAFPLAIGLPGKTAASRDLMNAMRPQLSTTGLAQARTDTQTVRAMASQLSTDMLPTLGAQLHMTPQQLQAYLTTGFPAVASGVAQVDGILARATGLQATMAAEQSNFRQADQIPTGFLPPTAMTWLFVAPGLVLLVIAGLGILRPAQARRLLAAGAAVGLALSVGLLATTLYAKASAADDLNTAFTPVFATAGVQQIHADTTTVASMSTELSQKALPAIAQALGMSATQLDQLVAGRFPAVATGLNELPQIVQRMQTSAALIEGNAGNFRQVTAIPWTSGTMVTLYWFMMVPALLILVVGAGAFLASRTTGGIAIAFPRLPSRPHHA
jgi:hypothetical protein